MYIHCLGLNHTTAPIQLREKLSFNEDQVRAALARRGCGGIHSIAKLIILSTCNRVELYAVSSQSSFSELETVLSETRAVTTGISSAAKNDGVPIQQTREGTMFTTFFSETKPVDWNTVKMADKSCFAKFFQKMLEGGVYLALSQFEAGFISTSHSSHVIDATIRVAEEAFRSW